MHSFGSSVPSPPAYAAEANADCCNTLPENSPCLTHRVAFVRCPPQAESEEPRTEGTDTKVLHVVDADKVDDGTRGFESLVSKVEEGIDPALVCDHIMDAIKSEVVPGIFKAEPLVVAVSQIPGANDTRHQAIEVSHSNAAVLQVIEVTNGGEYNVLGVFALKFMRRSAIVAYYAGQMGVMARTVEGMKRDPMEVVQIKGMGAPTVETYDGICKFVEHDTGLKSVFVYACDRRGPDGMIIQGGSNGTYRAGVAVPKDAWLHLGEALKVNISGVDMVANRVEGEYVVMGDKFNTCCGYFGQHGTDCFFDRKPEPRAPVRTLPKEIQEKVTGFTRTMMEQFKTYAVKKMRIPDSTHHEVPYMQMCTKFSMRGGLPGQACHDIERAEPLPESGKRPKRQRRTCDRFPCCTIGTQASLECSRRFYSDPTVAAFMRERDGDSPIRSQAGASTMTMDD